MRKQTILTTYNKQNIFVYIQPIFPGKAYIFYYDPNSNKSVCHYLLF